MMIAMIIHVAKYSGFTKVQKSWYLLTFASIMFCALAEFCVHSGYYTPSLRIPLTIITVLQFSLAPMLGVLFVGSLGLHSQAKIASGFFSLNLIVEVCAAPFGLIFYFNNEGYFRGDFFIVYEIFYFVSLIYLIINMVIVGKRFNHRDIFTIAMVLVILVAGIIPMTIFKLNITYIAIAICSSLCYIYYNDLVQQDIQAELILTQKMISKMQTQMTIGLANLIETRDMETGEHISRTSSFAKTLAQNARGDGVYASNLTDHFIDLLYVLAPLHDIGKIVIPDRILKKPGRLTEEEFEVMKNHAAVGGKVVKEVLNGVTDEEYIKLASDIATYHHERWDGSGYPKGLKGDEIPLSARIMAIADVYDALISERCYKKAYTIDEAISIIKEEAGTHFDPKLVEVFLNHLDSLKNRVS